MSNFIFLSVKFMLEIAALYGLLFYAVEGNAISALRAVGKRAYCFPISGLLQEGIYALLGTNYFSILYVLWNVLVLFFLQRLELRREKEFAGVWISYSVILFQFIQNFVTCMIYMIPVFAKQLKAFGAWERFLSTLLIWLLGAAAAAVSLVKLPERRTMSAKEARWAHGFFWLLFAAQCLLNYVLTEENMGNMMVVCAFVFLYLSIQLYYFSFMQFISERNEKIEQIQLKQQYQLQLRHYEQINLLYRKLRTVRHETKNQMLYMEQLLRSGQYDALTALFQKAGAELTPALEMPDCGNRLVNAILWSKGEEAKRRGIPLEPRAAVPEALPIAGHHLCSLLGNLLDNALDGSAGVEHPQIRVILRMKERYLYCCVSNRVDSDVLRENPALHTTKREAQEHGYGIPTIKKIAELYQGMTDFEVQNGEFVASVMLLCPEGQPL